MTVWPNRPQHNPALSQNWGKSARGGGRPICESKSLELADWSRCAGEHFHILILMGFFSMRLVCYECCVKCSETRCEFKLFCVMTSFATVIYVDKVKICLFESCTKSIVCRLWHQKCCDGKLCLGWGGSSNVPKETQTHTHAQKKLWCVRLISVMQWYSYLFHELFLSKLGTCTKVYLHERIDSCCPSAYWPSIHNLPIFTCQLFVWN